MNEKLKEALLNKLDKRMKSLKNDKEGLEEELKNVRLYDYEKNEFEQDLEKVDKEIKTVQDEKSDITRLGYEKKKIQDELEKRKNKVELRKDSLLKDKEQLEKELNNEKLYDNEREELEGDLQKVDNELKIVSDEENSLKDLQYKILEIDAKIDEYLVKYKIDKEKVTAKDEAKENSDDINENEDSKIEKKNSEKIEETKEKDIEKVAMESIIIENMANQSKMHNYEVKNTILDGENRETNQEVEKEEKFDLFQAIELDANSKTIKLIYKNEDNNKELPIEEAVNSKRAVFKRINMRAELSEYCKQERMGIFKKLKIRRSLDPSVIQAIDLYGGEDDLYIYFDSIAKNEGLPFDIHYNLTDSNLDKKSFNILNKYAKRDRNIEGITAEGVRENIVKRLIKGIKEGNILKALEKPKQIAANGVKKAKDAKDNIADKAKATRDNAANKTADRMNKLADKIRTNGHAEKIAIEYKEKQDVQGRQDNRSEEKRVTEAGREPGDD